MIVFFILIVILCLLILAGVIYGLIIIICRFTNRIINKTEFRDFKIIKKYRTTIIVISICLSVIFSCSYLFYNPSKNFSTAYIEKNGGKYILTLYGKRNLMAHDPISLLSKETFIDSIKFEIPRSEGIIDGLVIPNKLGSFEIVEGDAITIKDKTLKINLFYHNYNAKKNEPSNWNGSYELKWRN